MITDQTTATLPIRLIVRFDSPRSALSFDPMNANRTTYARRLLRAARSADARGWLAPARQPRDCELLCSRNRTVGHFHHRRPGGPVPTAIVIKLLATASQRAAGCNAGTAALGTNLHAAGLTAGARLFTVWLLVRELRPARSESRGVLSCHQRSALPS